MSRYLSRTAVITVDAVLKFTMEDMEKAQVWADAKGYNYDNVGHLLFDAHCSGVIDGSIDDVGSDHDE